MDFPTSTLGFTLNLRGTLTCHLLIVLKPALQSVTSLSGSYFSLSSNGSSLFSFALPLWLTAARLTRYIASLLGSMDARKAKVMHMLELTHAFAADEEVDTEQLERMLAQMDLFAPNADYLRLLPMRR